MKGLSMISTRILASVITLGGALVAAAFPAHAAATDYRFELVGKPQLSGQKDTVQIRLVHVSGGKPVPDAVIFESKADMGPASMATMTGPVTPMPAKGGVYSFVVDPEMAGTWALHLAAKVQGEPETVRGTVNADLVK